MSEIRHSHIWPGRSDGLGIRRLVRRIHPRAKILGMRYADLHRRLRHSLTCAREQKELEERLPWATTRHRTTAGRRIIPLLEP